MNAKMIEGLKAVRKGIDLVLEGYEELNSSGAENAVSTPEEKKPEPIKKEASNVVQGNFDPKKHTREELDAMTYNDIKKLAKQLGIPAVGNREELTARIIGETPSADEAEAPAEQGSSSTDKRSNAPKEVPVDDKDNDPLYAKVVNAVADMSTEEIADVLADIGVSAKGKREALIDKVVQAVRDGLLDFDDDDDTEATVTTEETVAPPVSDNEVSDDDEEEDDTNDLDNPNMTEARKDAILAQDEEARNLFASGEVTREDLVEFLQSFYDTEESMDDMSDDDLLDTYIDAVCRLIDDDGELNEEGAYTLNGEPACCGRFLNYSEDTNVFICEHCGEEYEAE